MANGKLPVVLQKGYGVNTPGELCGFDRDESIALVKTGRARPYNRRPLPEPEGGWDVAALLEAGIELPAATDKQKPKPTKPENKEAVSPVDKQIKTGDEVTKAVTG